MMKSLGATFFPPKLNEFQFGDFYCFSLPLFLTVIVLIDFRTNSFLKYRLIKRLKMHLHWRSVIVKTPPVTYVERTNKSYFYGICLGWEETNPSNIREHPYFTSVSMP
jgi:hypothetical protein